MKSSKILARRLSLSQGRFEGQFSSTPPSRVTYENASLDEYADDYVMASELHGVQLHSDEENLLKVFMDRAYRRVFFELFS